MLTFEETEQALKDFTDYVVRESKKRAPKASGDLKRSIKGDVKVSANSFEAFIIAEDYLPFIDKGVSGTEKKYNTPFSYKSKKPPVRFLQTWLKRKTGVFLGRDRRSAAFALQNSIFKKGIKPTKFFTIPFEKAFKQLPNELVESYALDIEDFIDFVLNNRKNANV